MGSAPALTKLWYLKNLDIFSHLRDEAHDMIDEASVMREVKKGERLYLLKIRLTHNDFADLIASTRETVTATFNKMKTKGLIDFENKYAVVRNLEKLKNICW